MQDIKGTRHDGQPCGSVAMEAVFLNSLGRETTAHRQVANNASLDSFLTEVQSKAYHVAYGALWDQELALDVVQESMLRFVEYYRGKPDGEWPALFRSVLNSKINDQRRKRLLANSKRKLLSLTGMGRVDPDQDEQLAEADLPSGQHDAGFSDPEAQTTGSQLQQQIAAALAKLAERQRQVFLLREQMGLSISETAETLGCSENSIKQHHFRALRAMRRLLSEVWEHEQA
jgi:RNA polymerase sigma-70 factor (ECF subfamily)